MNYLWLGLKKTVSKTASDVIKLIKVMFSTHAIPKSMIAGNIV